MRRVRCLTWNVRLGIQQGVPALARVIAGLGPDVVALQEVGCCWTMGPPGDTTAELAKAVGLPCAVHVVAIDDDGARFGQSLLSRWPLEEATRLDLPRGRDEPRRALSVRLARPGAPLRVVVTHLSHLPDERPPQGEALAEHVAGLVEAAEPGQPVLLMGDLNEPGRPPWLAGLCAGMQDADAEAARPTYPAASPRERLDYLLAHGAAWSGTRVVGEPDASDHRPLFSVLAVR